MPVGHKLLKYGRPIGQVVRPIGKSAHVHMHNLKTLRVGRRVDPARNLKRAMTALHELKKWDPATATPARARLAELEIEWTADLLVA